MPLSGDELERISEDAYAKRRIQMRTYCKRCGYNLRALPYVHKCPECGNEYNAMHSRMKGIFLPQFVAFPWLDSGIALVCITMAALTLVGGLQSNNARSIGVGCVYALVAFVLGFRAAIRVSKFARARLILRRIQRDQDQQAR